VAVLLFLLVVLLVGGGFLGYTYLTEQQALVAATGTATAQSQASTHEVATQNAVVTSIAATGSAQARATAGVLQTTTSGQPDYFDPLVQDNTTNPSWDNDGTSCFFASDGYHVHSEPGVSQFCFETVRAFQNATITVEMNIHAGYSGVLVFRLNGQGPLQNNQGYCFEVGTGGNYKISILGAPVIFQDWTDSPAIFKGLLSTNTLQVIVRESVLMFYVNGVYLTTVIDTTIAGGAIGFFSNTSADSPGDAVFTNLKVYVTP
jgi:hypothetical protein